jgi:hypothetical protein
MEGPGPLAYEGAHTVLGRALTRAREELGAVPLAGLVVLTDGADNGPDAVAETLPSLKAAAVPVYTVGLGAERHDRDIEVTRIEVPRSVLKGGALVLTCWPSGASRGAGFPGGGGRARGGRRTWSCRRRRRPRCAST